MAYDIGPKIGIDGEAEFRKAIQNINDNVKLLGSEMKLVTEEYRNNADSAEALAAKSDVLTRTYDQQEQHLTEVTKMLERARDEYDDNSSQVKKWQKVVLESKTALTKTANEIDGTRKAMDKLEDDTADAAGAFEDLEEQAGKTSEKFGAFSAAAGNLIASGIKGIASGIANVAATVWNMDEATEEYRVAQGRLVTAFESSGYTVEVAKEAYEELYKIMGDTDSATEAAQLMAKLVDNEKDFEKWTKIAAGVAGTFGDALPIESLIEAANETAKTGQLTGALADALNWAGIQEEDFQAKLDACSTESERNALIMETLTGAYDEASDAFYKNNEELIKSRENQAKMDEVTARLGDTIAGVKNEMLEKFGPAVAEIAEDVAEFIEGIDTEELFNKFSRAWSSIKGVWDAVVPYFKYVWVAIEGVFSVVEGVLVGDFETAWEGIKDIFSNVGEFFADIGQKIINGLTNGMNEAQARREATSFGEDARGGSFGGGTRGQNDTGDGYTTSGGAGDVYLDGRKVGSVVSGTQRNTTRAYSLV